VKKLLTLALALVALAAFSGPGIAQQKGVEKSRKTTNGSFGGDVQLKIDKASPKLMTGKVMGVDKMGKTFTVMAKGKEVTFNAAKLKVLHKVGGIIEITYTETPGGPMIAATVN
jgi:hypothetical protein